MARTASDRTWSESLTEPAYPFVREFDALCQSSRADQILTYWHSAEPALHQIARLDLTIERIRTVSSESQDALLVALIRLAQSHDHPATIALLAAMSPKCWSIARRVNPRLPNALASESTEELRRIAEDDMFEQIMRFPVDRVRRGVAGALGMNTLRAVVPSSHGRPRDPQPIALDDLADGVGSCELAGHPAGIVEPGERQLHPGEVPTRQTEVVAVLCWGVYEAGAISEDSARLLAEVYLGPGKTVAFEDAARRRGMSPDAAKQRCSRAARKLAAAVAAADTLQTTAA